MIQPERFQRVERLYHAALELEKPLRPEFLSKACAGDAELLREVESLLALETRAQDFLQERALDMAARAFPNDTTQPAGSLTGQVVSHYQVLEKIGEGGMGMVYKARDTRLARLVALKVLPGTSVRDPERRRRFVQEAKAASALNHPNIVTIHDIDSADGVDFIAMEYITGKPLDRLIGHNGLPLSEVLRYGVEVADSLARAHAAGIIHRDVKPANIMVTEEGHTKLLDFGLAKLTEPDAAGPGSTATLGMRTEAGTIAGTVAYMSPEQAQGKPLDARSDIFSFGVVLYEALTGQRPFAGDSRLLLLAAIIGGEAAPLVKVAPQVPPEMDRIVTRCLRKDCAKRFQHMLDLKVALEELKEESDSGRLSPSTVVPQRRPRWRKFTMSGFGIAAVAVALWFGLQRDRVHTGTPAPATPLTSFSGNERMPAFSPDGKQIAFVWNGENQDNPDIYVMFVAGSQPLRLTTAPAADTDPVWSPDGTRIAFLRERAVMIISSLGGPETKITTADCRGLDWSPDGKWLAVPDRDSPNVPCSLFLVSPATRERRRLIAADPLSLGDCEPAFSPDGRTLAFVRQRRVNGHEIWTTPTAGGPPHTILADDANISSIAWMPDGSEIVFSSERVFWNLWRVPAEGGKARTVPNTANGRTLAISATNPARLVFAMEATNIDIWRMAVPNGVPERFMTSTRSEWTPRYSPDGSKLVFLTDKGGMPQLWLADADGSHQRALWTDEFAGAPRWSPDGTRIAFDTRGHIAVLNAEGGEPRLVTDGPVFDSRPAWSHDGRCIYFRSHRSGTMQIWKIGAEGGTPTQVTRDGAWEAIESPDGKLLYYVRDRDRSGLWSVPVNGGEAGFVAPNVRRSWWTPAGDDIYFVDFEVKPPAIQQLNVRTRAIRTLRRFENLRPDFSPSLSGSPDGRWLVWSLEERLGSDLMAIDNFR